MKPSATRLFIGLALMLGVFYFVAYLEVSHSVGFEALGIFMNLPAWLLVFGSGIVAVIAVHSMKDVADTMNAVCIDKPTENQIRIGIKLFTLLIAVFSLGGLFCVIIGFILMLMDLSDPAVVASRLAVAMVGVAYGIFGSLFAVLLISYLQRQLFKLGKIEETETPLGVLKKSMFVPLMGFASVLSVLALLFITLFSFTPSDRDEYGHHGEEQTTTIKCLVPNASGLSYYDDVLYRGVSVGRVGRIKLMPNGVQIILRIYDNSIKIKKNDHVRIIDFVGGYHEGKKNYEGKAIDIVPGPVDSPLLRTNDVLEIFESTHKSNNLRISDLVMVKGMRDNQIEGIGLVVGLKGTGETGNMKLGNQKIKELFMRLENFTVAEGDIKHYFNIAIVMVSANLPPLSENGIPIDVWVSAIGSSTSLQGGTLLLTPLRGLDGKVYATARGLVMIKENTPNSGIISEGGRIERSIESKIIIRRKSFLGLKNPDIQTAQNIVDRINQHFNSTDMAIAVNPGKISLMIPEQHLKNPIEILNNILSLKINADKSSNSDKPEESLIEK